jgi:mono/diheme cytochrome c family protein
MSKKHKQSQRQPGETSFTAKPVDAPGRSTIKEIGSEPVANRASVPVLFIAVLGALLFWGDMYLVNNGGQLDARVYSPYRSIHELNNYQPKDASALLKAQGQKVYKLYCAACHQDDGNGNPSAFIPPLAGSDWVSPKDPHRMIRIVLNGLQGPITVNGKQYGTAAMLPWRDALKDEDVAGVLTYVRSTWGNKAPAVPVEQVKEIREATKDRGGSWTPADLLALPLKD